MVTGVADLEALAIINKQHVSNGDRRQAIDRPGDDAPMVNGVHMGEFVGEVTVGLDAKGRRLEIEDGLGKAPGDQTSTHAGREHHRDPTGGGILRRLSLRTQQYIAVSPESQPTGHHQRRHAGHQIKPAESIGEPRESSIGT